MQTQETILTPELAEFARTLNERGFKTFVFRSEIARVENGGREGVHTHLGFSREVDGQECFGSVSYSLNGYTFHMPIKPSREHGSGMFIGGDNVTEFDVLSITNAEKYASPFGTNHLVGTHANDNTHFAGLYVELAN